MLNSYGFVRGLFLLLITSFSIVDLLAQDSTLVTPTPDSLVVQDKAPRTNIFRRVAQDGTNAVRTVVSAYARPAHWQKRDVLYLGSALAISASALLVEKQVYAFMLDHQTSVLTPLERVGYRMGQPQINYPIMLTVWGSGVLFNSKWLRDTGIMVIASVTTSGLIQTASKTIFGRERPIAGLGNLDFKPFAGPSSFPSGHATLATATFWVLAKQVNFVPLKVLFYALPMVTGASRIYSGAHWLSDVFLGTGLGIAFAEAVVRLYPVIKSSNKFLINVSPGPNGLGMVVHL